MLIDYGFHTTIKFLILYYADFNFTWMSEHLEDQPKIQHDLTLKPLDAIGKPCKPHPAAIASCLEINASNCFSCKLLKIFFSWLAPSAAPRVIRKNISRIWVREYETSLIEIHKIENEWTWYRTFQKKKTPNKLNRISPLWQWRSAVAHPADRNVHH